MPGQSPSDYETQSRATQQRAERQRRDDVRAVLLFAGMTVVGVLGWLGLLVAMVWEAVTR